MREVRERNLRKMPGAVPMMRDNLYHNSESSKMYLAHAPISPRYVYSYGVRLLMYVYDADDFL